MSADSWSTCLKYIISKIFVFIIFNFYGLRTHFQLWVSAHLLSFCFFLTSLEALALEFLVNPGTSC